MIFTSFVSSCKNACYLLWWDITTDIISVILYLFSLQHQMFTIIMVCNISDYAYSDMIYANFPYRKGISMFSLPCIIFILPSCYFLLVISPWGIFVQLSDYEYISLPYFILSYLYVAFVCSQIFPHFQYIALILSHFMHYCSISCHQNIGSPQFSICEQKWKEPQISKKLMRTS